MTSFDLLRFFLPLLSSYSSTSFHFFSILFTSFFFTDEQLLSVCLDLFMAGSETTSNTLSFAILYMLKHQDVQKKVQEEMDRIVGRNRWPNLQDRSKYEILFYSCKIPECRFIQFFLFYLKTSIHRSCLNGDSKTR